MTVVNNRKLIAEWIVTELKNIDGGISTYDSSYTYLSNVFNNVYRGIKFLDDINDFPSLYVAAGTEFREFESQGLTLGNLDVTIRAYIRSDDNAKNLTDNLADDIEHVIYNISDVPEIGVLDILIDNIVTDEGLFEPYGLLEVELSVVYSLEASSCL